MSARDEYRKVRLNRLADLDAPRLSTVVTIADYAIAELEAENELLKTQIELVRQSFDTTYPGLGDPFKLRARYDEMTVELAALKGRRCETCNYAGDISAVGFAARCCQKCWGWVPLSAGCDDWTARAEEGGGP